MHVNTIILHYNSQSHGCYSVQFVMQTVLFPQTADLLGFSHMHSAETMTDSGSRNRNSKSCEQRCVEENAWQMSGVRSHPGWRPGKATGTPTTTGDNSGLQITSGCNHLPLNQVPGSQKVRLIKRLVCVYFTFPSKKLHLLIITFHCCKCKCNLNIFFPSLLNPLGSSASIMSFNYRENQETIRSLIFFFFTGFSIQQETTHAGRFVRNNTTHLLFTVTISQILALIRERHRQQAALRRC